ncbi:MAG: universal stress protein, partial [Burkholderiaceae bacterium]|nr:universal stress protein [Burkholderiaceae bacterium]
ALLAVWHTIQAFRHGDVLMIHLLNVQPPFSAYVAHHVDRELRADFHRERADAALAEARQLLDDIGVPYRVHSEVGDKARCIVDAARRLRCDRIVIGTARKSALVRAVGNSLTSRLLESSSVPVEVIGGAPADALERVVIPAGVGAGMAWLLVGGT